MLRGKTTPDIPPTSKPDVHHHDARCDDKTTQYRQARETKSDSK